MVGPRRFGLVGAFKVSITNKTSTVPLALKFIQGKMSLAEFFSVIELSVSAFEKW